MQTTKTTGDYLKLERKLRKAGWELVRWTGKHVLYRSPDGLHTIPLKKGTKHQGRCLMQSRQLAKRAGVEV